MALFHTTVLDNQIKALPTVGTASGSIATFDTDLTENLVSCVCDIPSGVNAVNVTATGINLCNTNIFNSVTIFTVNSDGTVTQNINDGRSEGNMVTLPLKAGTYTFSRGVVSGLMSLYYNDNGTWVFIAQNSNAESITFTLTDAQNIYIKMSVNGSYPTTFSPQMETGNKTTFHPFGDYYNVSFGETLTDTATYNAVTGVLTRNDTTTKQLDSCPIVTLNNETNNIYNDCGDTEVKFLLTVGKKIF